MKDHLTPERLGMETKRSILVLKKLIIVSSCNYRSTEIIPKVFSATICLFRQGRNTENVQPSPRTNENNRQTKIVTKTGVDTS